MPRRVFCFEVGERDQKSELIDRGPKLMKRSYTNYWKNSTWEHERGRADHLVDHLGSEQFQKRGVKEGDDIYVLTVMRGRVLLLGRMTVAQICTRQEAMDILGTKDVWGSKDHAIASRATTRSFDTVVSDSMARRLRFVTKNGEVGLEFKAVGQVDQQTLRSIRELTPSSAKLLDTLLPADQPLIAISDPARLTADDDTLVRRATTLMARGKVPIPRGIKTPKKSPTNKESFLRDPAVCAWVLQNANGRCEACAEDAPFKRDDGTPYLEEHHVKPLAMGGSDRITNAIGVCPDCHRRFHHGADRSLLTREIYKKVRRLVKE
jgi:hypothetical protein